MKAIATFASVPKTLFDHGDTELPKTRAYEMVVRIAPPSGGIYAVCQCGASTPSDDINALNFGTISHGLRVRVVAGGEAYAPA